MRFRSSHYLPSRSTFLHKWNVPHLCSLAGTHLQHHTWQEPESAQLAGHILIWFACPKIGTQSRCSVSSLMHSTTTPNCSDSYKFTSWQSQTLKSPGNTLLSTSDVQARWCNAVVAASLQRLGHVHLLEQSISTILNITVTNNHQCSIFTINKCGCCRVTYGFNISHLHNG